MELDYNKLLEAKEISKKNAEIILIEIGLREDNINYSIQLFELQNKIYNQLKLFLNITTE